MDGTEKPGKPARNPKELFDGALDLARNNRHEEALTMLEAAIADDHSFVKAHLLKASLLQPGRLRI
jgi:hypothetical protein